tara:strand:- start:342 stop:518 length:177 start_codon:yes stop_codon:yes gene_type:complete
MQKTEWTAWMARLEIRARVQWMPMGSSMGRDSGFRRQGAMGLSVVLAAAAAAAALEVA